MNHKFLLIYALAFLVLSPSVILCLRHQDKPNESALSETTPLNSIDTRSSLFNDKSEIGAEDLGDDGDDNDDDFNENDDDSYQKEHNQKLVVEMYRQQFEKQKQKDILKIEINDHQFTTMKPGRTTERSCLSSACLARKDLEQASRESIRQHILMKLGKINEPNQTRKYPNLPRQLLEQYCKRMDLSMDSCFGTTSHIVEYQSDGPIDSSYDDVFNGEQETITDEEDVQFLSFENRILAFPSSKLSSKFICFSVGLMWLVSVSKSVFKLLSIESFFFFILYCLHNLGVNLRRRHIKRPDHSQSLNAISQLFLAPQYLTFLLSLFALLTHNPTQCILHFTGTTTTDESFRMNLNFPDFFFLCSFLFPPTTNQPSNNPSVFPIWKFSILKLVWNIPSF